MTESSGIAELEPWVVHLPRSVKMSPAQFWEACQLNRDVRLELTAEGDVVIMPPAGARTGTRNARLIEQVTRWADADGSGVAFDSSTGFRLPNGAIRSPDAAWVRRTRIAELPPDSLERFLPLCPDFAVELRSPSDPLAVVQEKLSEYVANGTELGWLVDPTARCIYVYDASGRVERIDAPTKLSGGAVLPGFILDLGPIWDPGV